MIKKILYPGHIPTTTAEKGFIGLFSAFKALNNPHRADAIASLGETTGAFALNRLRNKMKACEDGLVLLKERPNVTSNLIEEYKLNELDKQSFGYAYYEFLSSHGYSPDERDAVHFVDDEELAFVMLRYRQIHDFAHVSFFIKCRVCVCVCFILT